MKNEKVKITGIKKAVGDYKNANKDVYSAHYGLMYFDKSDGRVWTDAHYDLSRSSQIFYHSEDIILISSKFFEYYDKMNMKNLNEFLEKKLYENELF